ncbi:MAG: LPS assembly protein LptD [Candidatus Omnitrophota bacterium]
MKLKIYTIITVLCAMMLISARFCFSEENNDKFMKFAKEGEPVVVNGDEVEYFELENKISAEGNVSIDYDDVKVTCDKIELNTVSRKALCEGSVIIVHPEGVIMGDRVWFDFIAKKGGAVGGEVEAFPWFGKASQVDKAGVNEYILKDGYATTCDLDKPHYRIKAKELRIFPDDKIIAKDVTFYIGDVPVLWFPYYYHPIIQSRAKVQFIPGKSTDWGNFLLSTWRFYVRKESKIDAYIDYRSKKGFAEGVDAYYNASDFGADGLGSGVFRSYFVHQNNLLTYDPAPYRDEWGERDEEHGDVKVSMRKRFQWKHRIDFDSINDEKNKVPSDNIETDIVDNKNGTVVGMFEFNRVSDEYVLKDYFFNEYGESASVPESYLSIISSQPDYSASLFMNGKFHEISTVTQKLPELKLDVPSRKMVSENIPLYYTSQTTATAFDRRYAWKSSPSEIVNRLDSYQKVSYAADLNLVEVVPYVDFRETMYSRTRWKHEPVYRGVLTEGVNASSRFFRVFNYNTDFLGLDINKLRHIITPSAEYVHVHPPNIKSGELYNMDGIDSVDKDNKVVFSLINKLQTKRGADDNLTSVDLIRFLTSVDYYFCMQKNELELKKTGEYRKHGRFKDFTLGLEVTPYNWLFINSGMTVDPKSYAISTGSLNLTMNPSDTFKMNMGYTYEKNNPDPRNQFIFDVYYKLNPKWQIGLYERFDVQKRIIDSQQLSITRDLHCWEVELVYDVEGSRVLRDQFNLWIAFKIKAFPDLPIGLSRTYNYRKPGCLRPGIE